MDEIWKDLPFGGQVSNYGNIKNKFGKNYTGTLDNCGIFIFNGIKVCKLVADAFVPITDPRKFKIRHKDGIKGNNRADNLERY